jgi:hypothetical protein
VFVAVGLRGAVLWAPFLVLSGMLVRAGARGGARVTLRVDALRRRALVREHRLLRAPRERDVDLADARAAGVEVERSPHWLSHLPTGALLEGCVVVRAEDGATHALFGPRFNVRAQARAARRLAELLEIEREPVAGLDHALPPASAGWPNARTYVLFATTIVLVALAGFTVQILATRSEGRLELRCTSACRFEGLECLPGGSISGSYPPGERVVEVADASAPGGHRTVRVPVRVRHRTVFECRPDATAPEPTPE